jgi:hypothetical protein
VEAGDEVVRGGGDDGAGVEGLIAPLVPPLPETGEGEDPAVREVDVVGLFSSVGLDPLVEA